MPRLPTHGDADAACSLYVYSHCSCREAVQVLMIVYELKKSQAVLCLTVRRCCWIAVVSSTCYLGHLQSDAIESRFGWLRQLTGAN